jgi:hypothetical protein
MSPIPFPQGLAREAARFKAMARQLEQMAVDLEHHVTIAPLAFARIGNLTHDATARAYEVIKVLAGMEEVNAARMCAQQDRSYPVESGEELASIVRRLAFDLTDGGAA